MPNWCSNEVVIQFDSQDEYDKFIEQAGIQESTDPYLSYNNEEQGYGFFDRFVPTPPEMLGDEGGWYDWRYENWGTKWNPNFNRFETDDEGRVIVMDMSTAWAPPREFFIAFSQLFPSATIEVMYLEEGMAFCGKGEFYQGCEIDSYINQIPTEMYVEAGAVLDANGDIDWEASDSINLWEVMHTSFDKYYEMEDN